MSTSAADDSPLVPMSAAEWVEAARPAAAAELERAGYEPWLSSLLARRGVGTAEEAEAFLTPSLDQLHPASALPNLEAALDRLTAARDAGERVALVADYDVDGVTAAAQLAAVFRACGLEVEVILPERLLEGYGFQPDHVERAVATGCSLVVTADCGSTSFAAVAAARSHGLDVIVTDHHIGRGAPPEGALEINPTRPGSSYPFPQLCASGLACKLALALAERCGRPVPEAALLRMASLGTIADMVPLLGENRAIAALGLAALPDTPSHGLQALMRRAGVRRPISGEDVGYRIGPRINAAGRMASASAALELLLTRDPVRAEALADELEALNQERRDAQHRVVDAALERFTGLDPLPRILVAWSEDWHRGVVGIAAGHLARRLHRPTILLSVADGIAHGSGRSIAGLHLHAFLGPWSEELERFGGHAQAIGLSARADRLADLQRRWVAAAAAWPMELLRRRFEYEATVEPDRLGGDLLAVLQRLEPFGVGNPEPTLRSGPLRLAAPPRRFGRGHLSVLATGPSGHAVTLVGWGWGDRLQELEGEIEALGQLRFDRYRQAPVLQLEAARPWRLPSAASP